MHTGSISKTLYHFFISFDDDKGDSGTKRAGRRAFIITGLVLLILGALVLACIYAFPGMPGMKVLASIGVTGGCILIATGFTLFILGLIREVGARKRAVRFSTNTRDSDDNDHSAHTRETYNPGHKRKQYLKNSGNSSIFLSSSTNPTSVTFLDNV